MSSFHVQSANVDLKPKRHHGYAVLLFIMGTLFPPLAVAARFGIGKDFWLNLLLTICGYIPGHGHNFYIQVIPSTSLQNLAQLALQNIRNNKNHARTPKWAQRYGLVDTSTIERHQRRSQWANRYNDRLPRSTLEGQPYADGQEQASSVDISLAETNPQRQPNGDLWRPEDETYYNPESSNRSSRWHYPANFEDAALPKRKKEKKVKKDRWAMTEDAYSQSQEQGKKSRRKKKKNRSSVTTDDTRDSRDSVAEFPEDPEGGLYADRNGQSAGRKEPSATGDAVFEHQF
ncbi:hypothetical protein C0992_000165 [Termitomyces sp. T32_za158]|nr:hypothetical protein C0992_000165 [Termitomyces sp. T32_za158]